MNCPLCERLWPDESEQAACIRIYNKCIVCCVDNEKKSGYEWNILDVERERHRFNNLNEPEGE